MANTPIDRNNKKDLILQKGRTEESISQINREIAKIDRELDRWPRRQKHLESLKAGLIQKISKRQAYINELDNDIDKFQ